MSVITLLTDFGTDDEYVGLMKGAILSINPGATIVDLSHRIDRHDIVQAAFAIRSGYPYFPQGTVHLIVVDPGVGTDRRLLALKSDGHFFIAPDNGVLTLLYRDKNVSSLNLIANPNYFKASASSTFHGRDIIAPVGAHIANGLDVNELGPETDLQNIMHLDGLRAHGTKNSELRGKIITIDHFGNLITNIHSNQLTQCLPAAAHDKLRIKMGSNVIEGLSETYANVPSDSPVAVIGSRGYLEIAINQGHAARRLKAVKGDDVWLLLK
jgi:S-adenosylmethionine hydrolase